MDYCKGLHQKFYYWGLKNHNWSFLEKRRQTVCTSTRICPHKKNMSSLCSSLASFRAQHNLYKNCSISTEVEISVVLGVDCYFVQVFLLTVKVVSGQNALGTSFTVQPQWVVIRQEGISSATSCVQFPVRGPLSTRRIFFGSGKAVSNASTAVVSGFVTDLQQGSPR